MLTQGYNRNQPKISWLHRWLRLHAGEVHQLRGTCQKQARCDLFQFMCEIADTVTSPKTLWASGRHFTGWVLNVVWVISNTSGSRSQSPVHDCSSKQKYTRVTSGMQVSPLLTIFHGLHPSTRAGVSAEVTTAFSAFLSRARRAVQVSAWIRTTLVLG